MISRPSRITGGRASKIADNREPSGSALVQHLTDLALNYQYRYIFLSALIGELLHFT